jgi:beta-phosphoglucomutase
MINGREIQNIIFDLDGVIVNSELLHYEAYRRAFKNYGLELTLKDYNANLRSKGRKQGLGALINAQAHHLIESISTDKDCIFDQILKNEGVELYEDAVSLIKMCKCQNISLAIGTASKMGINVLEKIQLKSFFNVIITSQDVTNNKPHPEIYIKCLQALDGRANNTIVIEDSEPGIIAALEAQLQVVYIKREKAGRLSESILHNENVFICEDLAVISNFLLSS